MVVNFSVLLILFFCSTLATLAPLVYSNDKNVEHIDGHYIVVYKKDVVKTTFQKQILKAKSQFGVENVRRVFQSVFQGYASKLSKDQLLEVRRNPLVDYVEMDSIVRISDKNSGAACAEELSGSWGQTRISEEIIHLDGTYTASETGGEGVTAYIVDTGIFVDNVDFEGRASFGFKASPSWSNTDENGHGTHVASTIGGRVYGVAKRVKLVAVKVLGDNGEGSISGVISGIDYVATQHASKKDGASTANLSLGGGKSKALNDALNAAVEMGVTFVVAAGNENDDACNYSPSSATGAITVASTGYRKDREGDEEDIRSSFSNYGTCVDVFAPGSNIKAAWIGNDTATNTISGTSMASPHVCGVASLVLGDSPLLSPEEVRATILSKANHKMIDLMCKGNKKCEITPNLLAYNGC